MRSARHRRREGRAVAGAVAAVVVLGAAGVVTWRYTAGGPAATARPCRLPVVPAPTGPAPATAPGGGGVRVAEQGHSQESLRLTGPPDGRSDRISMGAVLENTGTRIAYRTRVTFAAVDAAGAPAVHAKHRGWLVQEVPIILPGRRAPVGVALSPQTDRSGAPARVERVTVTAAVTQWLAPESGPFAAVTAAVAPGAATRDAEGTATVDYVTTSTWCAGLKPRGTALVFRNRAGSVVGGDLDLDGSPERCGVGVARQRLVTNPQAVPSTADLDRTEIGEHCDVAPATGLIPGSVVPTGVPIN